MKEQYEQLRQALLKIRNYQQLIASNAENRASLEKDRDREIGVGVQLVSEISTCYNNPV